ncbi:hypothetical protein [Spirochaeta africana]|nr:hypothetical protein [Spirochaeta africana]
MKTTITVLSAVLLTILAIGCQTVPSDIPEDLTPMEYFQRGQDEVDRRNFRGGLAYYETFLERYPDDIENGVVAEYWVAFIHHKMGERETAIAGFTELLAQEDELQGRVPEWPFILSRRVLEEMGEES